MSYDGSPLTDFNLINQASITVAHADGPTDVNTLLLSYPTAALHTYKPTSGLITKVPHGGKNRYLTLEFAVKHAADATGKKANVKVWSWCGSSRGLLLMDLTIEGGTADLSTVPPTKTVITPGTGDWAYCDNIIENQVNCPVWYRGEKEGNGIYSIRFDLDDDSDVFVDFDCDADAGVEASDAVCLGKFWS